jgi:hypothetical protein
MYELVIKNAVFYANYEALKQLQKSDQKFQNQKIVRNIELFHFSLFPKFLAYNFLGF